MDTPDDFIETEIKKILAILERQCERFSVDNQSLKLKESARLKAESKEQDEEEREPQHANG